MRFVQVMGIAAVVTGGGCVKDRTTPVEQSHEQSLTDIYEVATGQLVMPLCEGEPGGEHAPATHVVEHEGARIEQPCGTITAEITERDFLDTFVAGACTDGDEQGCLNTYRRMFFARLTERYAFADWPWVLNRCDAYPIECQQFAQIELWAMESHNQGVIDWAEVAMNEATAQHRAAYARAYQAEMDDRRRRAAAVQDAFEGFVNAGRDTVQCTSTTTGATTYTRCQ